MSTARIIAEEVAGHWLAWFSDDVNGAQAGATAKQAIFRLMSVAPGRCRTHKLTPVAENTFDGHVEYMVVDTLATCPACRGSGEYIGLNVRERCPTCDGLGTVLKDDY